MGVTVAVQKETQRARQLELLQLTANPIDAEIMGPKGRAALLRAVSESVGVDGEQVVPSQAEIDAKMKAAEQQAQQQALMNGQPPAPGQQEGMVGGMGQAGAQAQGSQQGGEQTSPTKDMGPRTRLAGGVQ